jgi:hypothetical protein
MDNWTLVLIICGILVGYTIWSMVKVVNMVSTETFLNYKSDIHDKMPGFIKSRVDPDRVDGVVDKWKDNPLFKYNPYVYVGTKIADKVASKNYILPSIPQPIIREGETRPPLPNIPPPPKWLGRYYGNKKS